MWHTPKELNSNHKRIFCGPQILFAKKPICSEFPETYFGLKSFEISIKQIFLVTFTSYFSQLFLGFDDRFHIIFFIWDDAWNPNLVNTGKFLKFNKIFENCKFFFATVYRHMEHNNEKINRS